MKTQISIHLAGMLSRCLRRLALLATGAVLATSQLSAQTPCGRYLGASPPPIILVPIQPATVTLQGNVRFHHVVWHDNLTLSRAILLAQYQGQRSPVAIHVLRNGRSHPVSVRKLLRGQEDLYLIPGDVVELR